MQNTYQEKIDNLEANNSPVRKKLEGGISGHDLFIPKRFLAEREELKVKKEPML